MFHRNWFIFFLFQYFWFCCWLFLCICYIPSLLRSASYSWIFSFIFNLNYVWIFKLFVDFVWSLLILFSILWALNREWKCINLRMLFLWIFNYCMDITIYLFWGLLSLLWPWVLIHHPSVLFSTWTWPFIGLSFLLNFF